MPVARSLQVAQSTGMLAALAEGPREPTELAEHLGLRADRAPGWSSKSSPRSATWSCGPTARYE